MRWFRRKSRREMKENFRKWNEKDPAIRVMMMVMTRNTFTDYWRQVRCVNCLSIILFNPHCNLWQTSSPHTHTPILKMRKLRQRKIRWLLQGIPEPSNRARIGPQEEQLLSSITSAYIWCDKQGWGVGRGIFAWAPKMMELRSTMKSGWKGKVGLEDQSAANLRMS